MYQLLSIWFSAPNPPLHSPLWFLMLGFCKPHFFFFSWIYAKPCQQGVLTSDCKLGEGRWELHVLYFLWVPVGFLIQWAAAQKPFLFQGQQFIFITVCWIRSLVFAVCTSSIAVLDLRNTIHTSYCLFQRCQCQLLAGGGEPFLSSQTAAAARVSPMLQKSEFQLQGGPSRSF